MNLELFLNKSKAADFVIAILALIPAAVIYYGSFSPDAAIYFTFFKNFFGQPFSYAPGTVSFGATSPLHVLLFAPVHALFGDYWMHAAKVLNLLLVAFGMVLLNRTLRGGTKTILLIALLVTVSTALLAATAQLFETGLAFLFVAWLYHDLENRRYERAMLLSGALYLVRPELLVVGGAAIAYIIVQTKAERRYIVYAGASLVLPLFYHVYMFSAGGTLLPASLFTPIITYIQDPTSWIERLGLTLAAFWSAPGLIYLAAAIVFLFLLTDGALSRYWRELFLALPLVLLYFIFPPKEQIIRYLVPILPPLLAMIARYVQQELKAQYTVRILVVSLFLAFGFGTATVARQPRLDEDLLLLRDLSPELNALAGPGDRVLLGEVQGQYYLDAPCISLTAAVGGDMLDVLLRRTSLKEFLAARDVKYIVTSNVADAAAGAERSLLNELSRHDRQSITGDTVEIDGVRFCKVLSSSKWTGRHVAVITPQAGESWTGNPGAQSQNPGPLWKSVYAVLGPASRVPEPAMAVIYDQGAIVDDSGWTGQGVEFLNPSPVRDAVDSVAVLIDSLEHQG